MPRSARRGSESRIYHVTVRGSGKRILFEDDADRRFYLAKLSHLIEDEDCEILAWCLMDNHVHLLIEADLSALTRLMHRLSTSYARRFNGRHGHVGAVFQGRFASLPIQRDSHVLEAVRYIHLNPKDLGVVDPADYKWSSYRQYLGADGICATERVLDALGGLDALRAFHDIGSDELRFIELLPIRRRISDAEARRIAEALFGERILNEIGEMQRIERDRHIGKLYRAGLSIRQIGRLTGLGTSLIQRAKDRAEGNPSPAIR